MSPDFIFAYVITGRTANPIAGYTRIFGGAGDDLAMHRAAPTVGTYDVGFTQTSGAFTIIYAAFKLD